ncbi:protein of unknown function [Burkholderia multivorans]
MCRRFRVCRDGRVRAEQRHVERRDADGEGRDGPRGDGEGRCHEEGRCDEEGQARDEEEGRDVARHDGQAGQGRQDEPGAVLSESGAVLNASPGRVPRPPRIGGRAAPFEEVSHVARRSRFRARAGRAARADDPPAVGAREPLAQRARGGHDGAVRLADL